jgi:hypothetical protein
MTRFSFYEPTAVTNKEIDESIDARAYTMATVCGSDSFLTVSHRERIGSETESPNTGERALDESFLEREVAWKKSSSNNCASDSLYQPILRHFNAGTTTKEHVVDDQETDEGKAFSVERTQTEETWLSSSSSECHEDGEDADRCALRGGDGGGRPVWHEVRVASDEDGVDSERVDDCTDHKGGITNAITVDPVQSIDSLVLEPTHSSSYSSSVGYTNKSEQDTDYSKITTDFTHSSSSSSEKYTNESENVTSLSLLDDQQLAMWARLSQSIVSSSKLLMAQNISKDNVVALQRAVEDKAREQKNKVDALLSQRLREIEEDKRDLVGERKGIIKEVEPHSDQVELALELEACRAENEALRAENEELRAQVDVRRFSFYKPSAVTSKEALELEAIRAENDALRAQVSDLLRSCDKDTNEGPLEATKMSKSSEESQGKRAADEVQTLRDENARLRMGAQRDSERIAKLVDEVRTLTHAAKAVVIAAKSCRSSAKATVTVSEGSTVSSAQSSVGSASLGTIDELRLVGSSVLVGSSERSVESSIGSTVGSSVRSSAVSSAVPSVGSSVRSSVGSSVGSSVETSTGSSTGSSNGSSAGTSLRLQEENMRLRVEAQRDSKRIQKLTDEVRMLTRAAAAVVVAAKSCQTAAEGVSGMSMGSLVGSVRLGSSVSLSSRSLKSALSSVGLTGRSVGSTVGSASFMGSTVKMRSVGSSVGVGGSSVGSSVRSPAGLFDMGLIDMGTLQETVAFWQDFVGMVLPVDSLEESSVQSSIESTVGSMLGLSVGLSSQSSTESSLGSSLG